RRNGAIGFLRKRADFVGAHVAGDNQDGIVWGVMRPIEIERILPVERADLVLPADNRLAVGMIGEERGLRRLGQDRRRVAVGARTALLEHDVALRQYV